MPHYVLRFGYVSTIGILQQLTHDCHFVASSTGSLRGRAFAACLGGPGFDARPSPTKEFKLVVEALLSNARHIYMYIYKVS